MSMLRMKEQKVTVYVQIFEGRKFRCFRSQLVIHEI